MQPTDPRTPPCGRRDAGTSLHGFAIGGVSFTVQTPFPLADSAADQVYARFRAMTAAPADLAVNIQIRDGDLPNLATASTLFESEHAWRLLTLAGTRHVCRMDADGRPVLVLRVDDSWQQIDAWMGPPLLSDDHGTTCLRLHPASYPIDQLLLMHRLAAHHGLILHAAGIVHDGCAHLFAGRCGSGKTTLAGKLAAEGCTVLSDDRVVVRRQAGHWMAYGTPWPGEGGYREADGYRLARLSFLHRPNRAPVADPLDSLLQIASIPWYDPAATAGALDTAELLLSDVAHRPVTFALDQSALPLLAWKNAFAETPHFGRLIPQPWGRNDI